MTDEPLQIPDFHLKIQVRISVKNQLFNGQQHKLNN